MTTIRVRATVTGRVQGVFYRASTQEQALNLGLVGYVKNLDTGQVEFEAEGDQNTVEKLLDWAKQGPDQARVDKVDIEPLEGPSPSSYSGFSILY